MGISAAIRKYSDHLTKKGKLLRAAWRAPLFRSMTHEALSELLDSCTQPYYLTDQVIVRQGDKDESVYLVLSGSVRVVQSIPDSEKENFVADLGPGEVFGELAVLGAQARSATVRALEPTSCLQAPGKAFLDALNQSPASSS